MSDLKASPVGEPLDIKALERYVASVQDFRRSVNPVSASVVIVAFETNAELIRCLDSLTEQSFRDFETIVVDNGGNDGVQSKLGHYSIEYVRLHANYKPSLARNVGITRSRGDVVCFLDDDAIADPDFVAQHWLAHQNGEVIGVRGRVLPRSRSIYNALAVHYDLGTDPVPCYADVEGNSSFKRSGLLEVGGFSSDVFGGEGADLSFRILRRFWEKATLVYWPGAVIYHDYALSLSELLEKTIRGARMSVVLQASHPKLRDFVNSYHPLPQGEPFRPRSLRERLWLAIIRRVERHLKSGARAWYQWRTAQGWSTG